MTYCPACRMCLPLYFNIHRRVADDYANNMNRDELIRLAICQRERLEESGHRQQGKRQAYIQTHRLLRKSNERKSMSAMAVQVSELLKQLREKNKQIAELQNAVKAGRQNLFGNK